MAVVMRRSDAKKLVEGKEIDRLNLNDESVTIYLSGEGGSLRFVREADRDGRGDAVLYWEDQIIWRG